MFFLFLKFEMCGGGYSSKTSLVFLYDSINGSIHFLSSFFFLSPQTVTKSNPKIEDYKLQVLGLSTFPNMVNRNLGL